MFTEILNLVSGQHYIALMLILILACILLGRNLQSKRVSTGGFWITIITCVLLIAQDILQNYAAHDPARRELRMIVSIAGYALRPAAVLGFLLVVWPAGKKKWFLWIPAILNAGLYVTALFTPLTFSFAEDYSIQRGPLSWVMFAVCLLYLIVTLVIIHISFRDRRAGDTLVIWICTLGCLGAVAVDILLGGISIVPAILISCMAFYLFLKAQDTDHDPLTRLWNRASFYEDCKKRGNTVSAVASIDMNGLKRTNDELGHDVGDRALRMIGRGMRTIMNKKISAYRVGGDEFMVLFFHCSEEETNAALKTFLDEMWRVGQSVSVGLAVKGDTDDNLDTMIRKSDQRMYEQKREYYLLHDRRQRR